MTRIMSWNVNGVRAVARNGFLDWLAEAKPDVLCIQETKAHPDQLEPGLVRPAGYESVWQAAVKRGYSGVATYFRTEPVSVSALGVKEIDREGRVQVVEFEGFTVVNAYFPNSQPERARIEYKLEFCEAMVKLCNRLRRAGRNVVVCGDYNIAHTEIDLARPKQNEDNPGFFPEEREAMTRLLEAGYVDTFRHFTPGPGHYTWWSYRAGAREKNIGWRIDYHCVNKEFLPRVKKSEILAEVRGSDHCPIALTIK